MSVTARTLGPLVVVLGSLAPLAAQDQPLPPAEAAARMILPPGFRATLFAGEPDVVQPIAFTFDPRGRLWVVECLSYPHWLRTGTGKDRVLVFEDRDGDGRFDTRKVFWDRGTNLSGIQVGFGGVWLCATPQLIFLPDRDGDDTPDGPPQVLLDGWSLDAKHNVFNGLAWGPDGWLYGCNGITATSQVGTPGIPAAQRTPMNCGVWRYHPTRHVFEVVAHGTTNPWGLDFDALGQIFITNCVIHHLWHVVPGAHFQRMFGQDFNPHLYRLMESCADHIHWGGGPWQSSRGGKGEHDQPGGGHAHAGCMVYLGDNWPAPYRGGLFTCNIHGCRVNHDLLERRGSGYLARHGKDLLHVPDPWFRGLGIQYGPDGGVYVSDWTDTGECHNYDKVHLSGRIFKVTHGSVVPWTGDLARLSDAELVQRLTHANAWHARQAQRLLQERAAAGRLTAGTRPALLRLLHTPGDVTHALRALWALHVTGGVEPALAAELLAAPREELRAWTVQLVLEDRQPSQAVRERLATMAAQDPSPFVRLYLASGLQRLPLEQRWDVARGLSAHAEDAADGNLSLMVWYGIEPLVTADLARFVALAGEAKVPLLRECVARRTASLAGAAGTAGLVELVQLLRRAGDGAVPDDVLRGMVAALEGRRDLALPAGWPDVYRALSRSSLASVRDQALRLAVHFGDPQALAALRQTALDAAAAPAERGRAVEALVQARTTDLVPVMQQLLADPGTRGAALRGLAAFADAATPALILRHYAACTEAEKADAIHTLASRPAYALALLDAVEKGTVPRRDVSAFTVRQMLGLNDRLVADRITRVWGQIRPASAERAAQMARYKALLTPKYLETADRSHGRQVYVRACAACHVLFGEGGRIGPELTGSQRSNLEYVLENLVDPGAVVPRDYQVSVFVLRDGRVVTGIVKEENDHVVKVQTQNEVLALAKPELEERTRSPLSMMPEGLLASLSPEEVRDLVAYLASPTQVALPAQGGGAGRR